MLLVVVVSDLNFQNPTLQVLVHALVLFHTCLELLLELVALGVAYPLTQVVLEVLLVFLSPVLLEPFVGFDDVRLIFESTSHLGEDYHHVETLHDLLREGCLFTTVVLLFVAEVLDVLDELLPVSYAFGGKLAA